MSISRELNRKYRFFPTEGISRFVLAASLGFWCSAFAFSSRAQEVSTIFAGDRNWLAISNNRLWGSGVSQAVGNIGGIATQGEDGSTNLFLTYRVGGETNWKYVTGMRDSNATTFAIRTDGSLWVWGSNNLGQLGDGTGLDSKVPVRVGTDSNWKSVSAADGKVFGVKTDGTLWAWGENRLNTGGLGIGRGRDTKQYLPVPVGIGNQWKSANPGTTNTWFLPSSEWRQFFPMPSVHFSSFTVRKAGGGAAITTSGELWSWGNALSLATNFSPMKFGSANDWKKVVFGPRPYALKNEGTLWQFVFSKGTNAGPGTNNYQFFKFEEFTRVEGEDATSWATLSAFSYEAPSFDSHQVLTNSLGEVDVFYFTGHVLGLKSDGTLWAWGNNSRSQLGIGSTVAKVLPQQVGEDTNWIEISAGPYWSMAKKADGSIWAWGDIGGSASPYVKVPTRVGADNDWLTAVAGSDYSQAVKTDGRVFACGQTEATPSVQTVFSPIKTDGTNRTDSTWTESGWTNGVAAYRRKMVAIEAGGDLRIWGDAFGDYPEDGRTNLPVPIPDDLDTARPWWDPERYEPGVLSLPGPWISVTGNSGTAKEGSGSDGNTLPQGFAAAVRGDGSLWTWGANTNGQLGDGTRIPKDLPVRIGAGTNWLKVEAGGGHILAMQRDGSVWAWGANDNGQHGAKATNLLSVFYNSNVISVTTNTSYDIRFAPVRVTTTITTNWEVTPYTLSAVDFDTNAVEPRNILPAAWGAREISSGGNGSLILKADGTLWELGRAGTTSSSVNLSNVGSLFPKTVKVITNIKVAPVRIETKTYYRSAVIDRTSDNRIKKVGSNGVTWSTMSSGDRHNLAVRSDGTLWAWGENESAQLGNGSLTGTNQPEKVGAGNRWRKAFAGFQHSLAIKDDGSLWAWGLNDGRLGLPFATAQTFYEPAKIDFGPAGLASITWENGKSGAERISGQGLAAFLPKTARAVFSAQLVEGILGPTRRPWEGEGQYLFAGRRLVFSNAYLSFLVTNGAGVPTGSVGLTNTNAIPREAFVRLEWAALDRSPTNPACYQGDARFVWIDPDSYTPVLAVADRHDRLKPKNGKTCRISFLFNEDQDGDGVPNIADAMPQGTAPVITSTNRLTLAVGSAIGLPYGITTKANTNSGTNTILANEDLSALPPGLFYTGNGFDGVPADAAVGLWEIVVGAQNDAGDAYQTVALNILPPPPVITSASSIIWRQGTSLFEYQITATNDGYPGHPVKYSAANLPTGLSVNSSNGYIRPTRAGQTNLPAPGLYRWSLVASNAAGTDTNTLLVSVEPPATGEWTAGVPLSYAVNLGSGTTYSVSGLPAGLTFNPSSGFITGTPLATGTNEVTVISRTRTATNTNRIFFPIRLGRPEIVGASSLAFTGASSLKRNEFFRYQISARSSGQPWAGASEFTAPLGTLWANASGFRANLSAVTGTLRYGWTNTNSAYASIDWSQPLPLEAAWQVSVQAAFSTNNLSGFLQTQQHLTAMLLALRDRSTGSAATNFISVYLEGSSNQPSGEVVAEGVVDGVTNGSVSEAAVGGRSALSFVYLPADGTMVTRADAGRTNLAWSEFQTSSLATWTNAARSNSLVLRLMGQSAASTNRPATYPFFRRFVVSPLGDLTYFSSNLPAGLILDPTTGLISGIPSVATNSQSSTVLISNGLGTTQLNILFRVQ